MSLDKLDRVLVEELRAKVATGCRIIAKMGLADYLGHISARIPGTNYALIKASGLLMGNLLTTTPDRIVLVDINEAKLVEGVHRIPIETVIHTEIYRVRPDVNCVVHDHQHYATAVAAAGKDVLPMLGVMAKPVARPLPVYPRACLIVTQEMAADMAKVMGDYPGIHLQNHGIVMTGSSVEEAVVNTIWLEIQAKVTYMSYAMGCPAPARQNEEDLYLNTKGGKVEDRWAYYCSLLDLPYVQL